MVLIKLVAFLAGFLKAFRKKNEAIVKHGKIVYCDGVPVTTSYNKVGRTIDETD